MRLVYAFQGRDQTFQASKLQGEEEESEKPKRLSASILFLMQDLLDRLNSYNCVTFSCSFAFVKKLLYPPIYLDILLCMYVYSHHPEKTQHLMQVNIDGNN